MRSSDLQAVAARLREPMRAFVRESRVRTALLVSHSGQILAHHGFARDMDVANVAALAAAAHASSHALAELTGAGRWMHLHHAGERNQLFLAPFDSGTERLILVAIFDRDSTLGLVQLFLDHFVEAVRAIPELQAAEPSADAAAFEGDLEAGLDRLLREHPEG